MRKKEEKEKAISLDICFAILSPQVVFLMKIAFMFALPPIITDRFNDK